MKSAMDPEGGGLEELAVLTTTGTKGLVAGRGRSDEKDVGDTEKLSSGKSGQRDQGAEITGLAVSEVCVDPLPSPVSDGVTDVDGIYSSFRPFTDSSNNHRFGAQRGNCVPSSRLNAGDSAWWETNNRVPTFTELTVEHVILVLPAEHGGSAPSPAARRCVLSVGKWARSLPLPRA